MAQKTNFKRDDFISKIVSDPKQVPDALLLRGFIGASSEDKHTRLYFDAQLSSYVEIPDDGILHTQELSTDKSPLGGSYVWINKDAVLVHGKASAERTRAKFLEGPIVNDYMRAAAQFPPDGGIDNTVAFCPETFADLPCGFTSNNVVCTINQLPTQQYCPTHWECPPTALCPPTHWHCPPPTFHHNICPSVVAICHTHICQFEQAGFAQAKQQAQPFGNTFVPCPTIVPVCNLTLIATVCPTHPLACNQPSVHQICVTQTPACHHTLVPAICATHTPACHHTLVPAICPTHTPACPFPTEICTHTPPCNQPSVIQICNTVVNPLCRITAAPACEIPTGNCPSFGACPSIACGGFGGGGNPAQ
jgi:hypothetical protein